MKNTRKSRKMHKLLAMVSCALLLVAISVGATVAYLTSQDAVTNTFTVGNVQIKLNETDTDNDNNPNDNETYTNDDGTAYSRDKANAYKLLPGHEYDKDPIVHVNKASEDCWLFVQITNEIAEIEDKNATIAAQMATNGWSLVDGTTNVYAHKDIAKAGDDVPVFATFKVADDVNNDTLATFDGKTVVVKAYAVQKDGFDTAAAAWTATFGA